MGIAGRKFGIGILSVGVALVGAGVFAGGATAGTAEGQLPKCDSASLVVPWDNVDLAEFSDSNGQTFSDGTLTVVISNPKPIPGQELSLLTVAQLDFTSNHAVDGVIMRLWEQPADYTYTLVQYNPAATSGTLVSPAGSHPTLGQAPIKGLEFCYPKPLATTTTVAATSTAAPTTVAPTTTAVAVEVLPEVVTAPEQLAFTGSNSSPLVMIGALLMAFGLALVGIDRYGVVRRGRHSR